MEKEIRKKQRLLVHAENCYGWNTIANGGDRKIIVISSVSIAGYCRMHSREYGKNCVWVPCNK